MGSGAGEAAVRVAVAEAHGGTVRAGPGGGLVVAVDPAPVPAAVPQAGQEARSSR
ncbi:hypothetical protein GCM10010249_31890 [Streptomyces roseolilacinus]|uniref:Uncharacterized protein n=1 Tax=Streptomyces roseolilacinus TaxID=66904 RepID=A0A918EMF7_9ACTN|nr:hypothetical protein GCM10010249_31890 [Streptomyces roseolilacinus]